MSLDSSALQTLVAKEEIRELAMLYSRAIDRKDMGLLASLYTADATDDHDESFSGSAVDYVAFITQAVAHMRYSGHHICNHLIAVDGDTAEGEIYAIAYHIIPDGKGGWAEDFMTCRYIDRYRREEGRWRFAARIVRYDWRTVRPVAPPEGPAPDPERDPSVTTLSSRLFARGARV